MREPTAKPALAGFFMCRFFPQFWFAAFQFKYHTVGLHKVLQALNSFHFCVINKFKNKK
jgi:hypothetical protein